jgi:hypothetical protein
VLLEETLARGPRVRFAMVEVGEGSQYRVKMAVQLWMAVLWIEDMSKQVSSKSTTRIPSGVAVSARIGRSLTTLPSAPPAHAQKVMASQ